MLNKQKSQKKLALLPLWRLNGFLPIFVQLVVSLVWPILVLSKK
ncbi:hypothetical protein BN389_21300 [Listeria monocytogenes serotype 4b str. LL195]|nr:hypothetical protein BN389_21300 [Listeria monocytogenes serotype 4b str. LL195]